MSEHEALIDDQNADRAHPYDYDLVVIGSGPAGEKGAAQAAYFGKKVALIEKETVLGGAMANSGVSAKALRESALHIAGFKQREIYGIGLAFDTEVSAQTFMHRERHVRDLAQGAVVVNLDNHGVRRYVGKASLRDAHTIHIQSDPGQTTITGNFILIATGARPVRPEMFGFHNPNVYDSNTILTMGKLPEKLVVVGGGIVGLEYASTFAALGLHVTIINAATVFLPFADREISHAFRRSMEQRLGIHVMMPDRVEAVNEIGNELELEMVTGSTVMGHAVLVAVGRASNSEGLGLENTKVKCGYRGLIEVNEHYQTEESNIYAAGDVIGFPGLTSTSMEQARVAMVHAFDLHYKTRLAKYLPYGIWSIPEVSMVGESEESLREKGVPYIVGKAKYIENPRGIVLGDETGILKLIYAAGDEMTLLGVHIIGENAAELIMLGTSALNLGVTAEHFIDLTFNYPSLMEMYKYATYHALQEKTAGHIRGAR